jgi:hypothetical protein
LIIIDIDTRKRHYHVSEAGRIIKYVVQWEIKNGEEWKEVICYDCAHDDAHKDFIIPIRGKSEILEKF